MLTPAFGSLAALVLAAAPAPAGPFEDRGYYITFMRMPTYDLAAWRRVVDGFHDDGGNLLLLWTAGPTGNSNSFASSAGSAVSGTRRSNARALTGTNK
jgi:hypothetical protein